MPIHGPIIRRLRLEREKTGRELAAEIDVQPPYVSRMENGGTLQVSAAVFRKLRAALGVPYAERRLLMANPHGAPEVDPEPAPETAEAMP